MDLGRETNKAWKALKVIAPKAVRRANSSGMAIYKVHTFFESMAMLF
jgi:hypothetical protein